MSLSKSTLRKGQLRMGDKGIPFIILSIWESGDPDNDRVDILIEGVVKGGLRAKTVKDHSHLVSSPPEG